MSLMLLAALLAPPTDGGAWVTSYEAAHHARFPAPPVRRALEVKVQVDDVNVPAPQVQHIQHHKGQPPFFAVVATRITPLLRQTLGKRSVLDVAGDGAGEPFPG